MLRGRGGDGDVKCRFTLARTVVVASLGGRGDDGRAVSMMDQIEVQQGWQALPVKARRRRAGAVPNLAW